MVDCAQVMVHVTLLEGTSDFASAATVQSRALTMTELWQTTYASFRDTVEGPASLKNEILKKFCALEAPCTLTWDFSEAAWIRDDAQRAETKEACSVLTSLLKQALPNLRALQALQKLVTWDETISQEIQDLIACLDDFELRRADARRALALVNWCDIMLRPNAANFTAKFKNVRSYVTQGLLMGPETLPPMLQKRIMEKQAEINAVDADGGTKGSTEAEQAQASAASGGSGDAVSRPRFKRRGGQAS